MSKAMAPDGSEGCALPGGILYVKSHDVVSEVSKALQEPGVPDGGPDSYVRHFLNVTRGCKVMLTSLLAGSSGMALHLGLIQAKVLPVTSKALGALRLLQHILQQRPAVIICGEMGLVLIAVYVASLLLRRPFIASCHNRLYCEDRGLVRRIMDRLNAWCLRRAAACICHGPFLKSQLLGLSVEERRICEYSWAFNFFRQAGANSPRVDLTDGGARRVVAFLGRVEDEKGVFDLLEALEPRLESDPTLRLAYIGDGAALERLRQLVEEIGLTGRVVALGGVPYKDIPALLRQAVAVATPTRSTFPEGRCMANMEAMALGIPAVVPNFGPFPFNTTHGVNGLLYAADSVEDLRRSILSLLDDPQLHARLAAGARRTGEEMAKGTNDYSWALRMALSLAGPEDRTRAFAGA